VLVQVVILHHLKIIVVSVANNNVDDAVSNANNNVDDAVNVDDNVGSGVSADNNIGKTWCVCEMPIEDYNEEEMTMVQCQGAACKQVWFHYKCIGKPKNWNPASIDYYCAYCSRRNTRV
jgi:hypothetical protein